MSTDTTHLHNSTDAAVWAKAWADTLAEHPGIAEDRGAMLGWFANAIMAGHDDGTRSASAELKRVRDALILIGMECEARGERVASAMIREVLWPDDKGGGR